MKCSNKIKERVRHQRNTNKKNKKKSVLRGKQAYQTATVREILGEKIMSKKKWLPELSGEETKITFYFVTFYTYCSFKQIF